MNRDPLRVLILLLPMLFASVYIPVGLVGYARAEEMAGDSKVIAPAIVTKSVGPAPLGFGSRVIDVAIQLADIGPSPEDLDAWEIQGTVDPDFARVLGVTDQFGRFHAVGNGPVLDQECSDMGGSTLYRSTYDPRTGFFAASELCTAGPPQPEDAGAVMGGDLAILRLQINTVGCVAIDLDESQTKLRDIDGFNSMSIPVSTMDGSFCNNPDFSAGFSGNAANVAPRKITLGDTVRFHANLQGTAPVYAIVEFRISGPSNLRDRSVAGPVTVTPGTGSTAFSADYMPTRVGSYQVTAIVYWSEDGGMNYIYAGEIQTRGLTFTVRAP